MKKITYLVISVLIFSRCTSIKQHNEHRNDLISVTDLKMMLTLFITGFKKCTQNCIGMYQKNN